MEFLDFFRNLLEWRDFMPHGHCYFWRPVILFLHVISDAIIALSYYSIPLALVYFLLRRRDLVFRRIFVMFGVFIVACGTTHVMSILTVWTPLYRLDGIIKLITAIASVGTAIMLWPVLPVAIALPSPEQMQTANARLRQEMLERIAVENALRASEDALLREKDNLEASVRDRTLEIQATTDTLQLELEKRKIIEQALRESITEKETLVREIHHRVKNNLQIISSILNLQSSGRAEDFSDIQSRLRTMSLVHDLLHRSGPMGRILFGDYLSKLTQYLSRLYSAPCVIQVESENLSLPADTAIHCGLIINELVTNALKHASRETNDLAISIQVKRGNADTVSIEVRDNGDSVWEKKSQYKSFGLKLVSILVEQLNGSMEMNDEVGTVCRLTFKIN